MADHNGPERPPARIIPVTPRQLHSHPQVPPVVIIECPGHGSQLSIATSASAEISGYPGGALIYASQTGAHGSPVTDTTGAGDAFTAALIAGLDQLQDPEEAARLAVAAAGLTVGHPGGRPELSWARLKEQLTSE